MTAILDSFDGKIAVLICVSSTRLLEKARALEKWQIWVEKLFESHFGIKVTLNVAKKNTSESNSLI